MALNSNITPISCELHFVVQLLVRVGSNSYHVMIDYTEKMIDAVRKISPKMIDEDLMKFHAFRTVKKWLDEYLAWT